MSKKKSPRHEFDNATITVVRTNDCQLFLVKDAIEFGLEKACILGNINNCRDTSHSGLRLFFSYIDPFKVDALINELIHEGKLVITEGGSNEQPSE